MNKINALKAALSYALISSGASIGMVDIINAGNSDCSYGECEKSAPYSLKIISYGEGAPKAANDSEAGLQKNRRVDVSIINRSRLETGLPAMAATLPAVEPEREYRGSYWVSKDPAALKPFLGIKVPPKATVSTGALESNINISIATNYSNFIEKWEILILPAGGSIETIPLHILQGQLSGTLTEVEWDGELASTHTSSDLTPGEKYDIALRVYDHNGNFDQTESSTIELVGNKETSPSAEVSLQSNVVSIKSLSSQLDDYSQNYVQQRIPVAGSTITLHGQNLEGVQSIEVNGDKVTVANNELNVQYILPPGDHQFTIVSSDKHGEQSDRVVDVEVKPNYFFMVGIADLTIGENSVTGSVEPLAIDQTRYGGDIFVDGRLAFYLKGKVRGKYLITAQMDTGHDDISALFDNFHRDDPGSIFRRIDPDQYYLVYGDDSAIVDDTDSQGKLYLRVDWDKSHALWGNFNTAFSGTEYASFNRSLYGARFQHRSVATTNQGDNKTDLSAFISETLTVSRHNEFEGTGGSLYYLRDQDIIPGSEKIWVEVRRSGSEQVLQKILLERGRDYELDEFQGRIILNRPLLNVSAEAAPSIIRNEPQPDENTVLVAEYEYVPSSFSEGDTSAGLRGKQWINNHVAVGGTWVHENRDGDDYDVKGIDVTVKKSSDTFFRAEFAQSESAQTSGSFMSDDGGLTFTAFSANTAASSGIATGFEARVSSNDFDGARKDITLAVWSKHRDAGFSTSGLESGVQTQDNGLEISARVAKSLSIAARTTRLEKKGLSEESIAAVQADFEFSDSVTISGEVRHIKNHSVPSANSESATLAAGKAKVTLSESISVYGIAQGVVNSSDNYKNNSLLTAGIEARVNDRLSLNGEISAGDRGTNLLLGAESRLTDTYGVYSNVNLLNDSNNNAQQTVTFGQRKTLSDRLKIYSEHQFSNDENQSGITNTVGLNNNFNRYTTGSLSVQSSRLEDELNNVTKRDTISAGVSYKHDKSYLSSKLEYRQDKSDTGVTDQWVTTNSIEYRQGPALRWQGRYNHSSTNDQTNGEDARFTEAGFGFAYRPVNHDRLNLLGRYTYLNDLPPALQSEDTDKRSSIFSMEGIYELGKRWSLGGKLAHRKGEIRTQRNEGNWMANDATLTGIRLRYHAPLGADMIASYHWLNSQASDNLREGALLAIGHNIGNNLQFSVGYNFTSFDDNLANEDYDVRGWFLNFVGKY